MKSLALFVLVTVAACGNNKTAEPAASDCATSINKGFEGIIARQKERQKEKNLTAEGETIFTNVVGKARAAITTRCVADRWSPEALACYAAVHSLREIPVCEQKLTPEQRTKVRADVRAITGAGRLPAGHPETLKGVGDPSAQAATPGSPVPAAPAGSAAAAPAGSAASAAAGSASPGGGW